MAAAKATQVWETENQVSFILSELGQKGKTAAATTLSTALDTYVAAIDTAQATLNTALATARAAIFS